ncbi:MAG TPA: hypothetical protein DIT10_12840 [Chryseobacterium sp.]|nr:hypothetical protein [Chryseobacterium sp.]
MIKMNNQLYLIIFWILASCGMPVSSSYQDKTISVISAEKTLWAGGRAGVKGSMYTIKLKKRKTAVITIKTLRAEGNTIPFSQDDSGNIITLKGNFQYKNEEESKVADIPEGVSTSIPDVQNLNPKDSWIEYTIKGSAVTYKINIPKFTSVQPAGDSIP